MSWFDPDWRVHPSETIKETLRERGIRWDELPFAIGVIKPVLDGEMPVTEEIAAVLADKTGVSAGLWLALQEQYDRPISLLHHARINELRSVLAETYTDEGIEIWLDHAVDKRWTFDYAMSLASALTDGGYV